MKEALIVDIDHAGSVMTHALATYFDYRFGRLPYRSLRFEHLSGVERYQVIGAINYLNDHAFTHITEFKYLIVQQHVSIPTMHENSQSKDNHAAQCPMPIR